MHHPSHPTDKLPLHSINVMNFRVLNSLLIFSLCCHSLSHAQSAGPSEPQGQELQGLPLPDKGPMLSDETGVRAGQWAISVALPLGGSGVQGFDDAVGAAGIWRLITDTIGLGLYIGTRISTQEELVSDQENQATTAQEVKQKTSSELILSPSVKYYTYQKGPIALYFIAQAHVRFFSDGDLATTTDKEPGVGETYNPDEDLQLKMQLGFGTEWFPTPSFSIGAHIGLQLDLLRQGAQEFALETFTSGLSGQFYF